MRQVVVLGELVSSDCNLKFIVKADRPVVLFSSNTNAAPGSPKPDVCLSPNALSVLVLCSTDVLPMAKPSAEATFLNPPATVAHAVAAVTNTGEAGTVPNAVVVAPVLVLQPAGTPELTLSKLSV